MSNSDAPHGEPELVVASSSGSDLHDGRKNLNHRDDIGLKSIVNAKVDSVPDNVVPPYPGENDYDEGEIHHPAERDDILTHTMHVEDDPTLQAITPRSLVIGTIMGVFGGVLSGVYYFKPQTVLISTVFTAVVSFLIGEAWWHIIPRNTRFGRWLNPDKMNSKEHLVVTIIGSSAGVSALGVELIAVERLYYDTKFSPAVGIFVLLSAQFLGYGMAGLLRKVLVYPKYMLWPYDIPVISMIENLHTRRPENRKPLKVFLIVFACIFCWEIIPEWIAPILTGFSVFCLSNQHNVNFTYMFGGASGDEGLGLFSLCFDWQYISGGTSPLYYPLETLISTGLGIVGCCLFYVYLWYGNVWDAQQYPFLSQTLFPNNTTLADQSYVQWDQSFVIGADNRINKTALDIIGLPNFATTNAAYNLTANMSIAGACVWVFLWYPREMMAALSMFDVRKWRLRAILAWPQQLKEHFRKGDQPEPMEAHYDPHYKLMLAYRACPNWMYAACMLICIAIAFALMYAQHSTLPWWAFLIAMAIAFFFTLVFSAIQGLTGIGWLTQSMIQLVGGYLLPGDPVSNMWFSLYGYNAMVQATYMAQDLKLAQYGHLAPRCTFFAQLYGTFIGCMFNYIMANQIIDNQYDILKSVEGTNIWSGQQAQTFNSNSITFGGLAHEMFSIGGKYQWTTLVILPGFLTPIPTYFLHKRWPNFGWDKLNVPMAILYLGWLCVGINSSIMSFFIIGFGAQWWLRRYRPNVFLRYNYLVSAALDGGTALIIFILTFAIFGGGGLAVSFPEWWGNNSNGNYDRCKYAD